MTPSGRILEVTATPLPAGGITLVVSDVTAAAQLKASEERYALAARGANDGLWDWDLMTEKIFFSARWKQILGYGEADIGDQPSEWIDRIHSEDIERVTAQLDSHLVGRVPHFESEHRLRHMDDSYLWVLVRGLAVRDSEGRAHRIAGSLSNITQRKRAEEQAIHEALHDALTKLPNRALLVDRVAQAIARSRRHGGTGFALLCLDLDRFKVVNDSLGHRVGDELLNAISQRLQSSVGLSDTVARLGGDEFAVLLEEATSPEEARRAAETLLVNLSAPVNIDARDIVTTGSIGIAHSLEEYERAEDMLRDAELAMYRAKSLGKARAELFDPSLHTHAIKLLTLDTDLRRAIERQELVLHYQPIVSLETGRVGGFEALLRWQHPERGLLSPAEFVPVAEETGLIVELGAWVLSEACARMHEWQQRFPSDPPLSVSVNLSIRQFNQIDLVGDVVETLSRSGWRAEHLKLELTETALMQNTKRAREILNQLKALDIRLSLDDFGTGYSSLSYLHTFPIDTLKIDQSFVANMVHDRGNLEIVRSIVLLAHNLDMDVVAEGVETPEQVAQLRALDCEFAQGFLFARPLDQAQAEALLALRQRW